MEKTPEGRNPGLNMFQRKDREPLMSNQEVILAITKSYSENEQYETTIIHDKDEVIVSITNTENGKTTVLTFLEHDSSLRLVIRDNETFMIQNPEGMIVPRGKNTQGQLTRILASIVNS